MEAMDHENIKESRTEKLLRGLKVAKDDFIDLKLPTTTFSYSQFAAWHICGKAYEFKYVKKEDLPNYPPLVRGVAVHSGIEYMLRKKMRGEVPNIEEAIAVTEDRFKEAAESVVDWGPDEDGTVRGEEAMLDQSRALIKIFSVEGFPKINPIAVEEGFAKKVGGVPMVGWIDLIDLQPAIDITGMSTKDALLAPKKTVVVDFKTTAKTWSKAQVLTNPQLTLYAAVKGTPHIRIDQLITTKAVKFIQAPAERTPTDVQNFEEAVAETADLIKKGVFPMTSIDHWSCNARHCSWWEKCRGRKR